MAPVSMTLRDF